MPASFPGPARRDVLRGAVAAAAGAVLLNNVPAARALSTGVAAGISPGAAAGIPVGVTLNTSLFPRGTTMKEALREWQLATNCRPQATKVYFQHRQFPRNADNDKIAACIATGMTAVLCFMPGYGPFRKDDAKALEESLAIFKKAGLKKACVVLWTEQEGKHFRPRLSAAEFVAGSKFYASAARSAGWPVYWNTMGKQSYWAEWCPGHAVNGYAIDDYASRGNWRDVWAKGGIARMADRDGKPFGWFEMGIAAGHSKRPSDATVKRYLDESAAYLASRAPGTTGPVMWWAGNERNALIPAARFPGNAWIARQSYRSMYRALVG